MTMTPKEKARELIEKANDFIYTSNAHFAADNAAKNCAMMVVDEILKAREAGNTGVIFDEDYWREVESNLKAIQ